MEIQNYINYSDSITLTLDYKGKVTFINKQGCKILEYDEDEILGKNWFENFVVPDFKFRLKEEFVNIMQKKVCLMKGFTNPVITKNGNQKFIKWYGEILEDTRGKYTGIFLKGQEITEQLHIKRDLRKSEEKYQNLVENFTDAVISIDENMDIILWNKGAQKIFGYSKEEIIGKSLLTIVPEKYRALKKRKFAKYQKTGTGFAINRTLELKGLTKAQTIVPLELSLSSMEVEGKHIATAIVRDISERRAIEERIEHLNLVLEAIRQVEQILSREKNKNVLLKKICNILAATRGYTNVWIALINDKNEIVDAIATGLDQKFPIFVEQITKQKTNISCIRKALVRSDIIITTEPKSQCTNCILKKTHGFNAAITIPLIYEDDLYGILSASLPSNFAANSEEQTLFKEIARDISFALHNIDIEEKRKKAEQSLREKEHWSNTILHSLQTGLIIIEEKTHKIIDVNPAAADLIGENINKIIGSICHNYICPNEKGKCPISNLGHSISNKECHLLKADGTKIPIIKSAVSVFLNNRSYLVENFVDISENKKREKELQEAKKSSRRVKPGKKRIFGQYES